MLFLQGNRVLIQWLETWLLLIKGKSTGTKEYTFNLLNKLITFFNFYHIYCFFRKRPMLLTPWNEFEANEGAQLANTIANNNIIIVMRVKVTTFNCKLQLPLLKKLLLLCLPHFNFNELIIYYFLRSISNNKACKLSAGESTNSSSHCIKVMVSISCFIIIHKDWKI